MRHLAVILLALTTAAAPNILFIMVDDLGYSDLGYTGSTVYETPNVDKLASEGMVFTDFYAAGPVCSPTRASIMTGKYPARTGITTYLLRPGKDAAHVTDHLPLAEFTIAEAFAEAGYATGYFGKWHLGYKADHWAGEQGWQTAKGGIDLPWAWTLCYPDQPAPTAKTWPKTHSRFFSPYHLTHLENGPEGEYLTDRLADETISFMRGQGDKPFFAFLSFHTVHTPLQAKREVVAKYKQKITALGLADKRESNKREKALQNNANYAAMVQHMDENVGRVVSAVDEMGLSKSTVIVFTSDNGGKGSVTSNLPFRGMKHNLYEGGIRVPTIVRWPGKVRPAVAKAPLISTDFYPTLLDLAGMPPRPAQHVDGQSFKPILLGDSQALDRDALFWHYPHGRNEGAVRAGAYKLVHRYGSQESELYNLQEDPGEQQDLSAKEPDRTAQMLASLTAWHRSVNARFAAPKRK